VNIDDVKKIINMEHGKLVAIPKRFVVHLKDDRNMVINGDEIMFMLNGDLVIQNKGKNVACFKFDSYEWVHEYSS
jgi:hypothetical protein